MSTSKRRFKKHARRRKLSWSWIVLGMIALTIGGLAFVAFGMGGHGEEPRRAVRPEPVVSEELLVTIDVVDDDYEPRHLTVRPGTKITWSFEGKRPHTVTDIAGAFDSGVLQRGDSYVLTFADPGEYAYYCTLHHAMQATLVVAE